MCGLSQKQIWRRQSTAPVKVYSDLPVGGSPKQCTISTVTNIDATQITKRILDKKVSFFHSVQVILIPCIIDYKEAHLCESLWYSAADMKCFHIETMQCLHKYLTTTHIKDGRRAIRLMLEEEVNSADDLLKI